MTSYRTVLQFREELQTMTPGSSLQGSAVYNILGLAFSNVSQHIYPRTLLKEVNTTNPFVSHLRRYLAPSDAINIVEIKKGDYYYYPKSLMDLYHDDFSREYKLQYVNGIPVIDIDDPYYSTTGTRVTIHDMENLTGATTTDLLNLAVEKVDAVDDYGITFDLDKDETSGTLTVTGLDVDLSSVDEDGSLYMFVRMPDVTYINNITLTISNATNSQTIVATGTQLATTFQNGDNLVRFPLDLNQGAITDSNVTGYTLTFNYNSSSTTLTSHITDIVIDNFYAANTEDITIKYQSNTPFYSSTYGFQTHPTSEEDTIYLEMDAYKLLLYEAGLIRTQGIQAEDGVYNYRYFRNALHGSGRQIGDYNLYEAQHPDEVPKHTTSYYGKVRQSY